MTLRIGRLTFTVGVHPWRYHKSPYGKECPPGERRWRLNVIFDIQRKS